MYGPQAQPCERCDDVVALLPSSEDYTDRDFDALRARLQSLVLSVFPEWSDFDVASFGNLLLEMFAFVGDVLGYYQDALARESRLVTATQRRHVISLAKMLGYRLSGAQAATATVRFSLARPPAAAVTLPPGMVVRTPQITEPVRFQLLAPTVIPAGATPPEVVAVVEHSKTHVQLVDARGAPALEVPLDFGPYLDGSASATTAQGEFSEVESFLSSRPSDRHFQVMVDPTDRATLRFGDGSAGVPPTGTVRVTYKIGGGAQGNVHAGQLTVVEGAFVDAHGNPVQVSAVNPEPASGGVNRQSIASAKLLAPESLRAPSRTVTREDFEINAQRLPGVARALMLTANEDPSIAENSGILFVVPRTDVSAAMPTPALRNQVLRQVTEVYPCTLTFQVSVQSPVYRRVDVAARVFLQPSATPGAVRDLVRAALAAYFRVSEADGTPNPAIHFGYYLGQRAGGGHGEIAWSDVFNVIRDTPGIRKIGDARTDLLLGGMPSDLRLALREFPALGAVVLRDGTTGAVL
ncbi:MAG: baseplate J/gp47 family protein [Myxococcales bacterium]|nr:baseplate J/gp47 family protein [Myxococcales bacterium]